MGTHNMGRQLFLEHQEEIWTVFTTYSARHFA